MVSHASLSVWTIGQEALPVKRHSEGGTGPEPERLKNKELFWVQTLNSLLTFRYQYVLSPFCLPSSSTRTRVWSWKTNSLPTLINSPTTVSLPQSPYHKSRSSCSTYLSSSLEITPAPSLRKMVPKRKTAAKTINPHDEKGTETPINWYSLLRGRVKSTSWSKLVLVYDCEEQALRIQSERSIFSDGGKEDSIGWYSKLRGSVKTTSWSEIVLVYDCEAQALRIQKKNSIGMREFLPADVRKLIRVKHSDRNCYCKKLDLPPRRDHVSIFVDSETRSKPTTDITAELLAVLHLDRLPFWARVSRSLKPKKWSVVYVVDLRHQINERLHDDEVWDFWANVVLRAEGITRCAV